MISVRPAPDEDTRQDALQGMVQWREGEKERVREGKGEREKEN